MALLKIHVTLQPETAADEKTRARVLDEIERVAEVQDVNRKRFDRYGLLTGVVDESKVDRIRQIPGVKSVEADTERYLH